MWFDRSQRVRLALSLLLAVAGAEALAGPQTRVTTPDFAAIDQEVTRLEATGDPRRIVVVLDIDNTLLVLDQDLGSEPWSLWQSDLLKDTATAGRAVAASNEGLFQVQAAIYALSGMHPNEVVIPAAIRRWQDAGVVVIALTSRGLDVRDSTFRELRRNGLDLGRTAPVAGNTTTDYLPYDLSRLADAGLGAEDVTRLKLGAPRLVSFQNGVLFTQGQHKGAMLRALIARTGAPVDAVVFVDDRSVHIDGMLAAYEDRPETLVAVQYTHAAPAVAAFIAGDKAEVDADWCELAPVLKHVFHKGDAAAALSFRLCLPD